MSGTINEKYFLKKKDALLLVIDIQEKLVPAIYGGEEVAAKTSILVQSAQLMNIPVLLTEQYPKGLGATVDSISKVLAKDSVISEKMSFSACTEEVTEILKQSGRKQIIIAGIETHVCVYQTVRQLLVEGYQVFLAEDAVGSRRIENKQNALEQMRDMGAVVSNTETMLFDLLEIAGTPLFKQVSKLIK